MSKEIDDLKAQNAELIRENAALKADPKQKLKNEWEREVWDVLKFIGDSSGELTASQIAGHFGIKENIAEHHIAILAGQNLLVGHPSIARLRMIGRAELAWKISPLGTHILLTSTRPA